MSSQRNKIIFPALVAALLLATQSPSAQTIAVVAPTVAPAPAPATSTKGTTAGRLAAEFSTSIGSTKDAQALVEGLRTGKDVTIAGTTVSGTGKTMGFGNIDIALSLAKSQVEPNATSAEFLGELNNVMGQRASGMGWGEIAKSMGVTVGQVMGASKGAKSADQDRSGKSVGNSTAANASGKSAGNGSRGDASGGSNGNGNAGGNGNGNGGAGGAGGGKK